MRSRLLGARGRANFTSRVKRRRPRPGFLGSLRLDIPGEGWFGFGGSGRLRCFVAWGCGMGVLVGDEISSFVFVVSGGGSVPLVGLLASVDILSMLARFLFS